MNKQSGGGDNNAKSTAAQKHNDTAAATCMAQQQQQQPQWQSSYRLQLVTISLTNFGQRIALNLANTSSDQLGVGIVAANCLIASVCGAINASQYNAVAAGGKK